MPAVEPLLISKVSSMNDFRRVWQKESPGGQYKDRKEGVRMTRKGSSSRDEVYRLTVDRGGAARCCRDRVLSVIQRSQGGGVYTR